jgi:hypothetical protein
MSKHPYVATASAVCLLTVLGLSALFAAAPASSDWNAVMKTYAEANLALAKARLASAMNANEAVRDAVSKDMLDALQAGVELAQADLNEIAKGESANPFAPQIAAAEKNLAGLVAEQKASIEANRVASGAVSELDMRRDAAEIAVAKAKLAALKSLANQPPEVRMQWQIGELQDQIRALWARPLIED